MSQIATIGVDHQYINVLDTTGAAGSIPDKFIWAKDINEINYMNTTLSEGS